MASQADATADTAEKAYAEAAEKVNPKKAAKTTPAKSRTKSAAPRRASATRNKAAVKARKTPKPAAKPTTNPAKPDTSEPKDTIMATAKTTDFTKTITDTAADLQTRAKTAYEKSQAYAGEVTAFTKGNVEALVESGTILAGGVQDIARDEVEATKSAFETATADMKALAAVRNSTDLFKVQGEIARRNFDAAVAHMSKNAEISMKLANDAFAPISTRMSLAAEKISKAA